MRKIASKPVVVAPATVVALNDMMVNTPYKFHRTDRGNLQFFKRYDFGGGAYTCPRQEVENYMQYVMKMPLDRAIDRTFVALGRGSIVAEA